MITYIFNSLFLRKSLMNILDKYKKNHDIGFKEFVKYLDTIPPNEMKELVGNCVFEDPVYIKWALENKLGFKSFIMLGKEDVLKVFHALKDPDITFLRALKNHSEENVFINANLPSLILNNYRENRETTQITVALQEDSRAKIMKIVYDLMEAGTLSQFHWKLPSAEVLAGASHVIDKFRKFKQYYEGGALALVGQVDDKEKRVGQWSNFFPNGSLQTEGNYTEGKKQEEWRIYDLNGNLKSVGHYKNNLKHGEWKVFDNENDFKIINYINGKIIK